MCFVMILQNFVSVESFAANYTGKTIDTCMSQCVAISIISLGECFGAKLALVSYTRVRFCAAGIWVPSTNVSTSFSMTRPFHPRV